MKIQILGKTWLLRFCEPLKDRYGDCSDPTSDRPAIRIDKTLKGQKALQITVHECLHALDWTKDESWVHAASKDLSKILWDLGYRKVEKD